MRLIIDFDGTITRKTVVNVSESQPNEEMIARINKLYLKGCSVKVFTSRGMLSAGSKEKAEKKYYDIVAGFLKEWGVMYDELIFGKESGDLYVDDLAMREIDFTKKNIYFFKMGRELITNIKDFGILPGNYESLAQLQILSQLYNVFIPENSIGDISQYSNVYYYKPKKHAPIIDYIFIDNGIMSEQQMSIDRKLDTKMADEQLHLLPMIDAPIIYSLTDPRLPFVTSLFDKKVITLHQNSRTFLSADIIRGHQEKLCLLNLPFIKPKKDREGYCIVARSKVNTDKIYHDTIKMLNHRYIHLYGNFNDSPLSKEENVKYHGMVNSKDLHEVYSKHLSCIMTPVEDGWLTQKLFEALHFGCDIHPVNYDNDCLELGKYELSELRERMKMFYRMDTWVEMYKDIFEHVDTIVNFGDDNE